MRYDKIVHSFFRVPKIILIFCFFNQTIIGLVTGKKVGFKAAGGIRTASEALEYRALVEEILGPDWLTPKLFRIGASSLLDSIVDALSD